MTENSTATQALKSDIEVPDVDLSSGVAGDAPLTEDDVTEAMKDVVDPELGINVVDLGLVYGVTVDDGPGKPAEGEADDGTPAGRTAIIDMTLTSAACPLTDVIEDQTRMALEHLVDAFKINWVWMPPWGPDKITEDGREQLRALGFNV